MTSPEVGARIVPTKGLGIGVTADDASRGRMILVAAKMECIVVNIVSVVWCLYCLTFSMSKARVSSLIRGIFVKLPFQARFNFSSALGMLAWLSSGPTDAFLAYLSIAWHDRGTTSPLELGAQWVGRDVRNHLVSRSFRL